MIILGIDPGSNITGFGVVRVEGTQSALIDSGVIKAAKAHDDHMMRLKSIYDSICELIGIHIPDLCAIEMPVYGNNPQSMLKLGRAQATAMMAALNHEIPVTEYTPKEIKKAVTGNGNVDEIGLPPLGLNSQSPISIEDKRSAIKSEVILAANLIDIHQGQTSFRHPRHCMTKAHIVFVQLKG